jgi:hypothetical protein
MSLNNTLLTTPVEGSNPDSNAVNLFRLASEKNDFAT